MRLLILAVLLASAPAFACNSHWCSNDTEGVLGDEIMAFDVPEWSSGCPESECWVEIWRVDSGNPFFLCGRVDHPADTFTLSGSACQSRPSPIQLDAIACVQRPDGSSSCSELSGNLVEFLLFACLEDDCETVCEGATHRNLQDAYPECGDSLF